MIDEKKDRKEMVYKSTVKEELSKKENE